MVDRRPDPESTRSDRPEVRDSNQAQVRCTKNDKTLVVRCVPYKWSITVFDFSRFFVDGSCKVRRKGQCRRLKGNRFRQCPRSRFSCPVSSYKKSIVCHEVSVPWFTCLCPSPLLEPCYDVRLFSSLVNVVMVETV